MKKKISPLVIIAVSAVVAIGSVALVISLSGPEGGAGTGADTGVATATQPPSGPEPATEPAPPSEPPSVTEQVMALDPQDEQIAEQLSTIVEAVPDEEVEGTIQELEEVLEEKPRQVEIICTLSLMYRRAGNSRQEYEMITRMRQQEKKGVRIPSTLKFIYGRAPLLEDELGISAARLMEKIEALIDVEDYDQALVQLRDEKGLLEPAWKEEKTALVKKLIKEREEAAAEAARVAERAARAEREAAEAQAAREAKEEAARALLEEQFVLVKAGTFTMGTPVEKISKDRPWEIPHTVTLTRDYYISRYEVSQSELKAVTGITPSSKTTMSNPHVRGGIGEDYAMYKVSWMEAVEYCNARSILEGLEPCYSGSGEDISCDFSADGYRLPTEAEWEYAAKGGNRSRGYDYAGSNTLEEIAWFSGNADKKIHKVGLKEPNELGIYDMTGNVREWCWDKEGDYPTRASTDPRGPDRGETPKKRILRGGSWQGMESCLVTERAADYYIGSASDANGFRVVRSGEQRVSAGQKKIENSGEVAVFTLMKGTLYIDSNRHSIVSPEKTEFIGGIESGRHTFEMHYSDGSIDSIELFIRENKTRRLLFSYIPESAKVYKVGDTGPAGGVVFYDKGDYDDGWRYLEVAPKETEWKDVRWGPSDSQLYSSSPITDLGQGRLKTASFIQFVGNDYPIYAAQKCDALSYGGYSDWFLPSKGELSEIWRKLHLKGKGGFAIDERYWSSTARSATTALAVKFPSGNTGSNLQTNKSAIFYVRAVRAF